MNPHLIILFAVVPMMAGIVTLLVQQRSWQRGIGAAMLTINAALGLWAVATVYHGPQQAGSILVTQIGNWPAPFGISVVVDPLAALMLAISGLVSLAVFVYSVGQLPQRFEGGLFHPLFHLLILGVNWSFITGDFFNLFVAFEIMLMASYAMFCAGTTRAQMSQAFKYVLLNLLGSTLLVTSAGLLYAQLGTLNMADMARIVQAGELPRTCVPVVALLLVVFGGKSAIFPLWFWLPDTYHTMPAAIAGLFAGLLTKVGTYVMVRMFVMVFGAEPLVQEAVFPLILFCAGVTMFLGVLGAVSMRTVRQILSIHIISQIGYMILGIGMLSELAVAGAIFFIIHNMAVKCGLFLCGGLMQAHAGSDDLDKIGGLLPRAPWLGAVFFIAAMSLAGLPPLSGFFGKFVLIKEALRLEHYVLVTLAVATSVLTLLSMLKIWSYGFWSPAKGRHVDEPAYRPATAGGMAAAGGLVVLALAMGLGAQGFMNVSVVAARGVVDARPYVAAVLGEQHAGAAAPRAAVAQADVAGEVTP